MTIDALPHQSAVVDLTRRKTLMPYFFLIGGFGCLASGAMLRTPNGDVDIKDFAGGLIDTPTGFRNATAPVPVRSNTVDLVVDGLRTRMSDAHPLALRNYSYQQAGHIAVRLSVGIALQSLRQTMQECDPVARIEGVQRCFETLLGFLDDYLHSFHCRDVLPHSEEVTDQEMTLLLEYALVHNRPCCEQGGLQILRASIRLYLGANRLVRELRHLPSPSPMHHSVPPLDHHVVADLVSGADLSCASLYVEELVNALQSLLYVLPHLQAALLGNTTDFSLPYLPPTYISYTQNPVYSMQYSGNDTVYRISVDGGEYFANGLLHHNCGKSFTDVIFLLTLVDEYRYCKEPIKFGIFGVTIKLLKQTVIADFCRFMDMLGYPYKLNSQDGTIVVGAITFVYLQMQNPGDIYAHNFHGALVDELDEVVAEKVLPIVEAIQERCRKVLPPGKTMPSRSAFMLFTTTAQGLGGTYQLVEKLKKQNRKARAQGLPPPVPYAIIHARTEDNPHNDPEQIKRLRALYTPEEAAAYLDGKFMNLAIGRVWYSFDRRVNMCMRFPTRVNDTIYVGQDFNLGINASCECIVRNDIIYIVASHHWKDMGEAAELLPKFYPGNRIVFIPDASGKEIMQGFATEFERAGIEIFWNNHNPSINERVMAGNLLFRRKQCYIMEPGEGRLRGEELIGLSSTQTPVGDIDNALTCLETHDIDEKTGKPRKGTGINAPDHFSDSFSYVIWRIIHSIRGYDEILEALKGIHHKDYEQ